ncbi:Octanoyltransferase LipM [Rubripirellula lacrimiformis]|uniref:Octanoyltransferase LipM n=1 Tax=Rubripirellula lacrimiformis TaxID=1930273 RepID=A0A517N6D9_9BACT|nr:lipoate--protein ligase family protein [Rubripirellula lacrimiformis]QDT02700.1 Octanoyltransferase LipM [Rubripirellula lacrimiformis]
MSLDEGRLIDLAAGDAAENMSLDQAMLESVDQGGPPTLRLYRWRKPTLSLGYFQRYADRKQHSESSQCVCVRRGSGGGAILHDSELTYSLAWPIDPRQTGANTRLYRLTHDAIARAIAEFGLRAVPHSVAGRNDISSGLAASAESGQADRDDNPARSVAEKRPDPFLCFQRRTADDLIVSGYKVLGSAQRKGKRAVLQHGSLLVRASPFAPELPGIWDLGGATDSVQQIAACVASNLSQTLQIAWNKAPFSRAEVVAAQKIAQDRYDNPDWLARR